jgi:hypothetical protein
MKEMKQVTKINRILPIIPIFLFLIFSSIVYVPYVDAFYKIFEKPEYSILPTCICSTKDGYIIGGSIFDDSGPNSWGWVAEVDKNGKQQWEKELGKKALDSNFYSISGSIQNNCFVIVGSVNGKNSGGPNEVARGWFVKILKNGKVNWDKTLTLTRTTRITGVKITPDKSLIMVGRSRGIEGDSGFIIKADSSGKIVWTKLIKGNWIDHIQVLHNSDFFVGGSNWIARIDRNGDIKWDKVLIKDKKLQVVTETKDNYLILSGNYQNKDHGLIWLDKFTQDGILVLAKTINDKTFCNVVAINTNTKNQIIGVGSTCINNEERIWSAIFDVNVELQLGHKYLIEKNAKLQSAIIEENGAFIAIGNKEGKQGTFDGWIFKGQYK